jgi:RNAse (barnase) inhibitor barstar
MASFTEREITEQTLDYRVLRDGGISLYRNLTFLDEDTRLLAGVGYRVVSIDCTKWISITAMHDSISAALQFPDYYGRNLHALNDCLRDDILIGEECGLLLNLLSFPNGNPEAKGLPAEAILDIATRAIREHMLAVRRFLAFVQTENPWTSFEKLGGVSAIWNRREWLNRDRGL